MSLAFEGEISTTIAAETRLCRDRSGFWEPELFRLRTCADCYGYLYPKKELKSYNHLLVSVNGSIYGHQTVLLPDVHNVTWKRSICRTLEGDECSGWTSCCLAAEDCCTKQREMALWYRDNLSKPMCPRTWDGYACWDDTPAGSHVFQLCPTFVQQSLPRSKFSELSLRLFIFI